MLLPDRPRERCGGRARCRRRADRRAACVHGTEVSRRPRHRHGPGLLHRRRRQLRLLGQQRRHRLSDQAGAADGWDARVDRPLRLRRERHGDQGRRALLGRVRRHLPEGSRVREQRDEDRIRIAAVQPVRREQQRRLLGRRRRQLHSQDTGRRRDHRRLRDTTQAQYVAADETNVYWSDQDLIGGSFVMAPVGGGTPTVVATDLTNPGSIAVDGTNVYYANSSTLFGTKFWKMPRTGGAPVMFALSADFGATRSPSTRPTYWAAYNGDRQGAARRGSLARPSPPDSSRRWTSRWTRRTSIG